ncbi:Pentatricopeptide repeat [Melia azedarach]|uniref:Pentatricopeptide repeat n=1 Tax=Melia azedarach TaxID=155640 RepID=A0ACC1YMT2_MELAZ|nr:Pentatricopeptide repeat [Melia azedarach]
MEGTINCSANYVPLTPISFLERAAIVTGIAVRRLRRCQVHVEAYASEMYQTCFLPLLTWEFLLEMEHLKFYQRLFPSCPLLVVIPECGELVSIVGKSLLASGNFEHESLLEMGKLDFDVRRPKDECDPISLNYTSGTSSSSKGVIYSHRGAYLNSLSTIIVNEMGSMPTYLWCVPMFHCNGWCLAWGMAAQGGANICRRSVTAKRIFDNIAQHKVTHFGGASTVLNMIVNAPARDQKSLPGKVAVITGCSPATPTSAYPKFTVMGLTETNGPGTFCIWKPERDSLPQDAQAKIKSRQGVQHLGLEKVDIKDPVTMASVPWDGKNHGRDKAKELFLEIKGTEINPNVVIYGSLVDGLCKNGLVDEAKELFSEMKCSNINPNVVVYSSLIHGLCCVGDWNEAKGLFIEMLDQGLPPNVVTFNVMIDELCKKRRMDEANVLLKMMIERSVNPNTITYSSLLDGYCLVGRIDDARKLFDSMMNKGCKPNLYSYNILINGYCRKGNVDEAMSLYRELVSKGIRPTIITFSTLLDGLLLASRTGDAQKVF